jgi:hypothetical protein
MLCLENMERITCKHIPSTGWRLCTLPRQMEETNHRFLTEADEIKSSGGASQCCYLASQTPNGSSSTSASNAAGETNAAKDGKNEAAASSMRWIRNCKVLLQGTSATGLGVGAQGRVEHKGECSREPESARFSSPHFSSKNRKQIDKGT